MKEKYMKLAYEESMKNSYNNYQDGGPFGAIIIDKNGNILSACHNTVLISKDSTCHAEINAIREASKKINSYDLSGCILYTSCYPCPMCLSAIIWANIDEVYYGNTKEDAADIGFRDDYIYDVIKNDIKINIKQKNRDLTIKAFNDFKNKSDSIY